MVMALAGNKADLEERRMVSAEVSVILLVFASSFCDIIDWFFYFPKVC